MTTKKTDETAATADAPTRRAIETELSTTMLVEAAAGTGKTSSLVARMVALVATGAARVENLSAVTFTIRAAAQLSQRFQNELEKRRESEADAGRRRNLDDALRALESSFVGTIHAFCARLLRERPVEAGVDPAFREMDEPEDNVARDEAWERHIQSLFVANDPAIPRLAALGVRLGDLREAYDEICENSDVRPAIGPETPEPDFAEARRRVGAFLELAAGAMPAEAGPDGWTGFESAVRRAVRLSALLDTSRGPDFVQVLQALRGSKAREKAPRALKAALESLQEEVVKPALRQWAEHLHPIVIPLLVAARDAYRDWRRENGRLNFQDLLLEARDLLRARPDVRRALRGRFTPILVDEFQDTDPIQAEILFYLTGEDSDESDWRKLKPAPGSLFVVGDPKQSIYRFRRADIETYQTVRRLIEESGGKVLTLSTNFRSSATLCDWVNRVFGQPDFFPDADAAAGGLRRPRSESLRRSRQPRRVPAGGPRLRQPRRPGGAKRLGADQPIHRGGDRVAPAFAGRLHDSLSPAPLHGGLRPGPRGARRPLRDRRGRRLRGVRRARRTHARSWNPWPTRTIPCPSSRRCAGRSSASTTTRSTASRVRAAVSGSPPSPRRTPIRGSCAPHDCCGKRSRRSRPCRRRRPSRASAAAWGSPPSPRPRSSARAAPAICSRRWPPRESSPRKASTSRPSCESSGACGRRT